jgi:hypothetical protein
VQAICFCFVTTLFFFLSSLGARLWVDVVCTALLPSFLHDACITCTCVRAAWTRFTTCFPPCSTCSFLSLARYLLYTPAFILLVLFFVVVVVVRSDAVRFISYPPFRPRLSLSATNLYLSGFLHIVPCTSVSRLVSSCLVLSCLVYICGCVRVCVCVRVGAWCASCSPSSPSSPLLRAVRRGAR